jgi:hypothetical protein
MNINANVRALAPAMQQGNATVQTFMAGQGALAVSAVAVYWDELHLILSVIVGRTISEPLFWADVARLLEPNMKGLKDAFSENKYPELRRRLSEMDEHRRDAIRRWETEMNRKLGH